MKKLQVLILLALTLQINLIAQDKYTARLKYIEAEEAFNNENYSLALALINEVDLILGGANETTLYLRIRILDKRLPANPLANISQSAVINQLVELHDNIVTYLKSFEDSPNIEKYNEILSISKNYNKLGVNFELFSQVQKQDANACFEFGYYLYSKNDYSSAFKYYNISAEQKHPQACSKLGVFYYSGYDINNKILDGDLKKSFDFFKIAAEKDDWEAICYLGLFYYFGLYIPKDTVIANNYFRKAIERNKSITKYEAAYSDAAMYMLGYFYESGLGCKKNLNMAKLCYENVAKISYSIYNKSACEKTEQFNKIIKLKESAESALIKMDYKTAIDNYISLNKLEPSAETKSKIYQTQVKYGDKFYSTKDYSVALILYRNALTNAGKDSIRIVSKISDAEMQYENTFFDKAKISNKLEDYEDYIYRYPKGKYVSQVNTILEDKYYQLATAMFDQKFWFSAKSYFDKYQVYFQNGKHILEVEKKQKIVNKKIEYANKHPKKK